MAFDPNAYLAEFGDDAAPTATLTPPATSAAAPAAFDPKAYLAEMQKEDQDQIKNLANKKDAEGNAVYDELEAGAEADQSGDVDGRNTAFEVFKHRNRNPEPFSLKRLGKGVAGAITGLGGVAVGAGKMAENIKEITRDYMGDAADLAKYYLGGDKQEAMAGLGKRDKSEQIEASELLTSTTKAAKGLAVDLPIGVGNFLANRVYDARSWVTGKGISDEELRERFDRMVASRAVDKEIEKTGGIEGMTIGPEARAEQALPLKGDETPEQVKKIMEGRAQIVNEIREDLHQQQGAAEFGMIPASAFDNAVVKTVAGGALRGAGKLTGLAGKVGAKGGGTGALYGIFSHSPEITATSLAAKYVLPPAADLLTEAGNSIFTGKAVSGGLLRRTAGRALGAASTGATIGAGFALGSDRPEDALASVLGGALAGPVLMFDPIHSLLPEAKSRGVVLSDRADAIKAAEAKLDRVGMIKEAGNEIPRSMPEHADGMNLLSQGDQDAVNFAQGILNKHTTKNGEQIEVNVLPEDVYLDKELEQTKVSKNARGFVGKDGHIYLNAGAAGEAGGTSRSLRHEVGHVTERLSEILGQDFSSELSASMTKGLYDRKGDPVPEFKTFIDKYGKDIKGTKDRAGMEREFIAETVNNILEGKPLEEWAVKTGLGERLREGASDMLKKLGIKPKNTDGTYGFEEIVDVSKKMRKALRAISDGAIDRARETLAERDARQTPGEEPPAGEEPAPGEEPPVAPVELSPEATNAKARRESLGLTTSTISKARGTAVDDAVSSLRLRYGKREPSDKALTKAKVDANREFDDNLHRYMSDLEEAGVPHPAGADLTEALRLSEIAQDQGGLPKFRRWGRHGQPGAATEAPGVSPEAQERLNKAQEDQKAAQELGDPEMIAQAEAELAAAEEAAKPATANDTQSESAPAEDAVDRRNRQSRLERELAEIEGDLSYTKVGSPERQRIYDRAAEIRGELKEFAPAAKLEAAKPEPKRGEPATEADVSEAIAYAETDARRAEQGKKDTPTGQARVRAGVSSALMDIASQDAGTDPDLLQHRENGTFSGRLDLSLPSHRALAEHAGVGDAADNLEKLDNLMGQNVKLDYGSAPKLGPSTSAAQRRIEQKASTTKQRLQGGPRFEAKGKPYIPVRFMVTQEGNLIVRGFSPEKLASNVQKVLDYMSKSKDPVLNKYIKENYKGVADPQLQEDILGYIENHKNNRKGDGSGTIKGRKVPDGASAPYMIPRNKFDVLNAAMHGDVSTSTSEKLRGRAEAAQERAFENEWQVDDETGDTNPLRAAINRSAKPRGALGEATKSWAETHLEPTIEALHPELIDNIRPFEEGGDRRSVRPTAKDIKAGIPDWGAVEAGFMPRSSEKGVLADQAAREETRGALAQPSKEKADPQKEYDALLKDPARLADEHKNENGVRVLNGDSIIAANPRMKGATPAEAIKVSGELYPEAKAARDRALDHLLAQPIEGNGEVLVMAGGMGSGKSTVARTMANPEFIYDTNLKNFKEASEQIDKIVDSGRNVTVALVARDPGDAMRGNMARAMTENRVGSAADLGEANSLAREVAKKLAEHYKGNESVKFTAFENAHGEAPKEVPLDQVKDISVDDASASAYNALHEIINGTDKVWKGPKPSQEIIDAAYGQGPRKGKAGTQDRGGRAATSDEGKVPGPGGEAKGALAEPEPTANDTQSKTEGALGDFMPRSEETPTKPSYHEKDKRTGRRTLITTKKVSANDAKALSDALRQANQRWHDGLREAIAGGEAESLDAAFPAFDLEKLGFKLNPKTNTFQHDESSGLKRIGGGGESRTYADGRVAYKVFYPQVDFFGDQLVRDGSIGIEGFWEQRPDGSYKIEHRNGTTGSLLTKLAVLSAIGGIPSEIVGRTEKGAIVVKQPDARNFQYETYDQAKAGMEAKAQLEPVAKTETIRLHPWNRITVVDGKPYILSDLNSGNVINDTKGEFRMLDPVVAEVPQEIIDQNPELAAQIERMTAAEADRVTDFMPRSSKKGALSEEERPGGISAAINPGYGRKMNPGLSYEQAQDVTKRVMDRIAPKGKLTFLDNLGIDHTIEETIGQFEGKQEPSMVIKLPGKSLEEMTTIATLIGDSLLQDAVIPHEFTPDGSQSGVLLTTGKGKMSRKAEADFRKWAEEQGQDFTLWKDGDEIMIFDPLTFAKEGYDAQDFQNFLDTVVPAVKGFGFDAIEFKQNSNYIDHEQYQKTLQDSTRTEGSSDLLKAARRDLYIPSTEEFKAYFDSIGKDPEGQWPNLDEHLRYEDEHGLTRNKVTGEFMPRSEKSFLDTAREQENEKQTTKPRRAKGEDERDEAGDLEAALTHVRGDQEGPGDLGGNPAQTQRRALARWALENDRQIDKIPKSFLDEGAEHGIWNGPDGRTWKVATGGGLTPTLSPTGDYTMERGTPEQYLQRLQMGREVLGDTTRLEGVHIGINGIPKFVVSQKTVPGPHPSEQGTISDWMEERGFERARYGDYTYFNKDTGVAIFDAHTDNFRYDKPAGKGDRNLVPIDVAVIKPEGEMLKSLRSDVGEESGALADSDFMPRSDKGALAGEEEPAAKKKLIWSKIKSETERKRVLRQRIADYKEEFPESLPLEYKKDKNGKFVLDSKNQKPKPVQVQYGLHDTPLALKAGKGIEDRKERRAAIAEAYSDELVKHVEQVRKNPAIMAGEDWYRVARTKIKKLFGDDTVLFAQLLGATSPNTNVKQNFRYAIDAYNQHKSGAYDGFVEKYLELEGKLANGDLTWEKDFGDHKKGDQVTGKSFRKYIESQGILPMSPGGKKLGMHSQSVLNVLAGLWEERVGGPKTPNFAGNLSGKTLEATIDVWAARNLLRLGNEGHGKKPWRILPEAEDSVTNPDFYMAQDAYRRAAKKLKVNPDDLQGVIWFAEKDAWDKRGWTDKMGAEKGDFNQYLARTKRRGALMELAPEEVVKNPKKTGALAK